MQFSLGIPLSTIADPIEPCAHCGSTRRKEIVPHKVQGDSVVIQCEDAPGYGCPNCTLKSYPPQIGLQLLEKSRVLAQEGGDITLAEELARETRFQRNHLPEHKTI